jgi:shikimate kinase
MTAISLGFQNVLATDHMAPHVILVGISGAGKSTVGALVAEKLGRVFMDLDREIEKREQATVSELFAEKGEPYFRTKERELTEELSRMGNMILAPGGGWITNTDVVALLRPPGRIIYLKVKPETAMKRIGDERGTRPLLMRPDPLGELKRLLKQREPMFIKADHVIDTEKLKAQQVVEQVMKLAGAPGRR